jgi:ion channel-forming bestrophin family protein
MTQAIWIYCLALPFQLVASSGWITIPIVFFMAFILFGAYKICLLIESPFGYDGNDISLDEFCW